MELRDYLALVRRWKWLIGATVLLVAGTAWGLSALQTPVYEARARLIIQPGQSVFDTSNLQTGAALVQTEIQVLQSEAVRAAVREKLGQARSVSASAVGTTAIIEVRAQSTDPKEAADVTNAYVDTYIELRRKQAIDGLLAAAAEIQNRIDSGQKQINELADRIANIPPCSGTNPPANCSQRIPLERDRDALVTQQVPFKQKIDQLQVDLSLKNGGAQVINPALASPDPVRPRPLRNALLGVVVGLLFGMGLAYVLDHLDDSIKSKEDLERISRDLPVLGMIPTVAMWKNRAQTRIVSQSDPTSSVAEAYRSLRTSIRFIGLDRSMRTIQVTSPNASDGKTTTVANLAVALARAGERVVIVSCDLRRPRIHEFFDLPNDIGFMSVVLGEMPLSAALQQVPGEARLQLLATGPIPANPSELLSSNRSAQVLAALRKEFSVVLIDCPPVLPVTDAAVLSAKVDGTLLVATVGTTTGKHVTRSLELLRQVGAPLVGMVLNGVGAQGSYGYHTYYGQGAGSVPNGAKPKRPTVGEGTVKQA